MLTTPLVITMGDPTGIGPEIIIKAAASGGFDGCGPVVIAGDTGVLRRAAELTGVHAELVEGSELPLATHDLVIEGSPLPIQNLSVLAVTELTFGRPDEACGRAMAEYIHWACDRCLDGSAAGMVTAPINKQALQAGGIDHPGHTEMLAAHCATGNVVMMLAGDRLRVCMVTTHCALSEVPHLIDQGRILATLRITANELKRRFGLADPRIAVLALNPHAGESGLFGDEEQRIIAPAIELARTEGINASGPHSADTLFWFAARGDYDAVVCMYHDQGLIPLKLLHFEDGVNITLGLPIIRTSVDHGTAYDLAGTGQASCKSLVAAVKTAAEMVKSSEP